MVDEKLAPSGRDGKRVRGTRERDRRARRAESAEPSRVESERYGLCVVWVWVWVPYVREYVSVRETSVRVSVRLSTRERAIARGEGGRTNEEEWEREKEAREREMREEGRGEKGKSATLATAVTGTADYYYYLLLTTYYSLLLPLLLAVSFSLEMNEERKSV